jgi:hypothetical protein
MSNTTYIFRWDRHGRKGQRCVVLARGTMNSCLVRFEDGYMTVTSRNALGIKAPFNPTVAIETVSAALAFAKSGITIRHSELPVVVPLARSPRRSAHGVMRPNGRCHWRHCGRRPASCPETAFKLKV